MIDKQDAERVDLAVYRHGSVLDECLMGPELPKDAPADYCLDGIAQFRAQMVRDVDSLIARGASGEAVYLYLQDIIRQGVEVGISDWMEQERDPSSCAHGDEAAIAILQTVTGTLMGDGNYVRFSARQIAMHGWAILFALGRTRKSQAQIGHEFGYTRANVSAVVNHYKKKFKLRKSRGMRSDEAVEAYTERAKRVHKQRKQKEDQCKTHNNSFNKFWTSTPEPSKPLMTAQSN